ncbi:GNAT family N-acetyltransferase [Agrobacterium vaccinii]|uniref:GNAT family N-acetyltransferase n=1 Tax=Agrobacterium vaccinii TaxID=2735528 RepID=UPI001E591CEA|nr:GNAT family N-acetyltransferase [Agrobacterium vaccinii]UHS63947.1 GNAT family N-acetyltransferase [Agrobacterium vaccinii]
MAALNGSFPLPGNLALRFVQAQDQPFLLQLLIEARPWLSWVDGKPDFLRMLHKQQFDTLREGLGNAYPEHMDMVIEDNCNRVGRLVVSLGYSNWRLSELQVMTAARGKGIGTKVVRGLQAAAENMDIPITLSTPMFGTSARHIYERLGFQLTGTEPPHYHMRWLPRPQVVSKMQQ